MYKKGRRVQVKVYCLGEGGGSVVAGGCHRLMCSPALKDVFDSENL